MAYCGRHPGRNTQRNCFARVRFCSFAIHHSQDVISERYPAARSLDWMIRTGWPHHEHEFGS